MNTLYIPTEADLKKWVKEAVKEYFDNTERKEKEEEEEPLLTRKEMAKLLRISLVTLTDWKRRGLPSHKQRGRVYFLKSEVMEYIRKKNIRQIPFSTRYIDTTS